MIVVTTTLTFGASLHTLVSQPALYGWNWDYAVQSSDGYGPVPNRAGGDDAPVTTPRSRRSPVSRS